MDNSQRFPPQHQGLLQGQQPPDPQLQALSFSPFKEIQFTPEQERFLLLSAEWLRWLEKEFIERSKLRLAALPPTDVTVLTEYVAQQAEQAGAIGFIMQMIIIHRTNTAALSNSSEKGSIHQAAYNKAAVHLNLDT